jgi:hypothetical protein
MWITIAWQHITSSDFEGFWEVLYIQWTDTDNDMLWNGSEEDGNVMS